MLGWCLRVSRRFELILWRLRPGIGRTGVLFWMEWLVPDGHGRTLEPIEWLRVGEKTFGGQTVFVQIGYCVCETVDS
jgi:hypothetical protein